MTEAPSVVTDKITDKSLKEIAKVFLRLGVFGFGGPVATVAMMEQEACVKRNWLTPKEFGQAMAVSKLMPGPLATQMAIHIGRTTGGRLGGLLAGLLFILPAFILVLAISAYYFGDRVTKPTNLFLGFQVGALAVILGSVYSLAKPYTKKPDAWIIALISAAIIWVNAGLEPIVILVFGLCGVWFKGMNKGKGAPREGAISLALLASLFWVCFKAGTFVFGTGLAIVPVLEFDVVQKYGWMTHTEFLDGLAVGQVTPGPVVITATFIGYKVAGLLGAMVATVGIFLTAFVNFLFIIPRIIKFLQNSPYGESFTAWSIPAVIGGILGITLKLMGQTLNQASLIVLFSVCMILVISKKVPTWGVIVGSGVILYLL